MAEERLKIVSGGQTGVDQGALAAALDCGARCGGWCPEGRRSEDGAIPPVYPVRELRGAGYAERTLQNVRDSDATAIIFAGVLDGGTKLTLAACIDQARPYLLLDASATTWRDAVEALTRFVESHGVETLNVAGPRASKWPEAHDYARLVLTAVLMALNPP